MPCLHDPNCLLCLKEQLTQAVAALNAERQRCEQLERALRNAERIGAQRAGRRIKVDPAGKSL